MTVDWQVVLVTAPVLLELLRLTHQPAFHHARPLFALQPPPARGWMHLLVPLGTVMAVAIPIKIWNSARIEHRLAEQEHLLMVARVDALANQINPHFLFNTLTSISSLIRSQPETARVLIVKLSALLRRLLRSQEHFVTLREELEAVDEYLDIERIRFGPTLVVDKQIDEDCLDVVVPSMILQPLVENSIKHGLGRKLGEGRITIARDSRRRGLLVIEVLRQRRRPAADADGGRIGKRHRPAQRERTAARDLWRAVPAQAGQPARPGHVRPDRDSGDAWRPTARPPDIDG